MGSALEERWLATGDGRYVLRVDAAPRLDRLSPAERPYFEALVALSQGSLAARQAGAPAPPGGRRSVSATLRSLASALAAWTSPISHRGPRAR